MHILMLILGWKSHNSLNVSTYVASRRGGVSTVIELYIINFFFRPEVLGSAEAGRQGWATLVERFCYEMIMWSAVVTCPD